MRKFFNKTISLFIVMIIALISCTFIGITGAKYMSQYNGIGGISTKKFDVYATVNSQQSQILTLSNETTSASYSFSVTSNSEVDVTYDVILTLPSNLPSNVTMIIDNTIAPTKNGNVFTFLKVGKFIVGESQNVNEHVITISGTNFYTNILIEGIKVNIAASQLY